MHSEERVLKEAEAGLREAIPRVDDDTRRRAVRRLRGLGAGGGALGLGAEDGAAARFADAAAGAFLDQDLLRAVRGFLAGAKGSFGLFASCSLDAHRQFVLAARGQTMSLAFYPRQGVVLWGSEQARAPAP